MYMCVSVCLSPHFFTHSSAEGHFDRVHVLAIVNNAAMDTGAQVSF